MRKAWRLIEVENDPVMQNNLTWLAANCDSFDVSDEERLKWLGKSAAAGYPVALSNYGLILIRGRDVRKNTAKGVVYLLDAHEGGYATALAYLSEEFSTGKNMRKNLRSAKAYLRQAKRDGADAPAIDRAEKALAEASGTSSQNGSRCYVTLRHVCSIAPSGIGSRDAVALRSFPTISFAGCGGDTARGLTLAGNRIKRDDDNKTIPSNVIAQLEKQLSAFKRKAIRAHPHCNKSTQTFARIYRSKDAARSGQGFLMSLANAAIRDSYYID